MAQPTGGVPVRLHGATGHFSRPFPLGVADAAPGVPSVEGLANVAVFAPDCEALDIVFTRPDGSLASAQLFDYTEGVHHGSVDGLGPGARYALWPSGAPRPADGQLLIDPYARAIVEDDDGVRWGVHVPGGFDWAGDRHPHVPWRDTVVYEAHVKGLTMLHPEIPEELRGTYAGVAHPVMVGHLRSLGVTTVQLLPIHYHVDEPHLQELGLTNYWGYNTLGFFAPHPGYATAAARAAGPKAVQDEVKAMVRDLHAAGLEVVLDVVYNHTAEGGPGQGALSWRGLADRTYYRHDHDGHYLDTTGCGNTLDFSEPVVVRMAMDSLRHWVEEYHVDGFRFDLAVSLARGADHQFSARHPFLVSLLASEALQGTKLIAEPWDVAMGGWQTGRFPRGFADWNDRYRDTVRDFWVADHGALAAGGQGGSMARLAGCLAGSRDLFAGSGRGALSSVNYVTAHDGFTLRDLVSYDRKHNEDNGEENRDGHGDNRSHNHGVEGATADAAIGAARLQTASNVMATLLLSLGVPMICAGDEIGRTQRGNNNAYCQDNPLSWLDWRLDDDRRAMLETTRALARIRHEFLAGQPYTYPARDDSSFLLWFDAAGEPMDVDEWNDPGTRLLQLLIGSPDGELGGLVVFNGHLGARDAVLPDAEEIGDLRARADRAARYDLRFSTGPALRARKGEVLAGGGRVSFPGNSVTVFRV